MAFSQADLTALESAIAQGALVVQYTDKRIEYRSLDEMLAARNLIRRKLGLAPKTMRLYPRHSKGFHSCG